MNKKDFIKWYNILSDNGKIHLVLNPFSNNPMSINVCYYEIINDTKLGKAILKQL